MLTNNMVVLPGAAHGDNNEVSSDMQLVRCLQLAIDAIRCTCSSVANSVNRSAAGATSSCHKLAMKALVHASLVQLHTHRLMSIMFTAGVIFWQWGFAPYVAEEFLQGCMHCQAIQVSASDGVFKNIIAPVAEHAAKVALSRSPVAGCKPGG